MERAKEEAIHRIPGLVTVSDLIWSSLQPNYIFTSNAEAEGHDKGHFRDAIGKTQSVRS